MTFITDNIKKSIASRGKDAEADVKAVFSAISAKVAEFDFERIADARAAGGRMKATTADFQYFRPGAHGVCEVKEVKHDYRLPLTEERRKQINRIRRRALAGGEVIFLVKHTTSGLWRRVPLDVLVTEKQKPSIDLSDLPTHKTCKEALSEVPGMKLLATFA